MSMTVKSIRVRRVLAPWTDPPAFAPGYNRPREIVVVEVETAGGITGMGYLQVLAGGSESLVACLKELVVPHVLSRSISDVEGVWHDLWRANYWVGRMGIAVMAQSAIDVALWDALGQHAGLPLHRLWGHHTSEIQAYGSGCWRGLGPDGMVEKAQRYVEQGFSAIKMQAGHLWDGHQDAANVAKMREALGPAVDIMIDVNMGWTADEAIRIGRRFDAHDVYWVEEPVVCEDFAGYLRIADALDTKIVGGETHFTRYDIRPFLENPKLPILQPDVMRGGFTELKKIATLADTWGMTLAPHLFPELMVQLMASIPNGLTIEYVNWMDDAWEEPVLPANGVYTAPERPGHGMRFKPEFLSEHTVDDVTAR